MSKLSILLAFGLVLVLGQQAQGSVKRDVKKRDFGFGSHLNVQRDDVIDGSATPDFLDEEHDATTNDIFVEENYDPTTNDYVDDYDWRDYIVEYFSWPELTGKTGEEAKKEILSEHPDFDVTILPENSLVTEDFRPHRVRIFVDKDGIVVDFPYNG